MTGNMSLKNLRRALDSKEVGAVELTKYYLDRIEKYDKNINSYITVCKKEALSDAEKAQKMINGGKSSPLTGIPVSIKDNICTASVRTTCASKMLEDFVPFYDATAVTNLKSQNAVIIGKTNMDEFGMGSSSQTSYFGAAKNPHDTRYVTGGSSGGSAAAVAADLCAIALGSDTGGSVRQPSSFCGVTGLMPTYGTVSRYGLIAFVSSLDRIGIIGKSASDTGFVLDCIYGTDKNDMTASDITKGNYTSKLGTDISKIKIGIPKEFFSAINDEVRNSVLKAADYYKLLGCELIECSLPSLEYAVSAYYLISSAEAASNLSRFDGIKYGFNSGLGDDYNLLISRSRSEGFGKEVKRRIMLGNYALSEGYYDAYYNTARRIRTQITKEYYDIFEKCDVLLTPTAPATAYKISSDKSPSKMYLEDILTVTANIAGLCAISTPCGYSSEGLPIGMSITGKAFDEATIIAMCDRYERDFTRKEAVL